MIEHELLILTIQTNYPQLVHGVDYWVGHPLANGVQSGDAYIVQWNLTDPPEPQLAILLAQAVTLRPVLAGIKARAQRTQLLVESDWTQMPDVALTDEQKAAYVTYRALLRGVPEQPGFPDTISWPVMPA